MCQLRWCWMLVETHSLCWMVRRTNVYSLFSFTWNACQIFGPFTPRASNHADRFLQPLRHLSFLLSPPPHPIDYSKIFFVCPPQTHLYPTLLTLFACLSPVQTLPADTTQVWTTSAHRMSVSVWAVYVFWAVFMSACMEQLGRTTVLLTTSLQLLQDVPMWL